MNQIICRITDRDNPNQMLDPCLTTWYIMYQYMLFIQNTRSKKLLCLILNLEIYKYMLTSTNMLLYYSIKIFINMVQTCIELIPGQK